MSSQPLSPTPPLPPGSAEAGLGGARSSLFRHAWLALASIFVVVRALPILSYPLGRDQGTYLTIGQGLLDGKQLYLDLWDNKPPGIFYIYAAIARVFGRTMWSVPVADILLLLVISYLLFRFAEPCLGSAGAAIAVMVHASWHGEMRYFWIAQPETFQVACVLAAYLLVKRRGRWWKTACLAAGLLLGYACWLKYNALAFAPLVLFLPFLNMSGLDREPPRVSLNVPWRDWLARAGLLVAGASAVGGIVLAWIVAHGAWPAMKEAQFEVLARYAAMGVERNPHYWLSMLFRTNRFLGEWNLWAALAGLLAAWMWRDLARFATIFLAAASAYAAVVGQVRLHDYYFQTCYPFFALIWAYLAVRLYEGSCIGARGLRRRGLRVASLLVWVLLAQAVFWPLPDEFGKLAMRYEELREWRADPEALYAGYPRQLPFELLRGQLEVIHYLEKNARPDDGVYVWGSNCLIYFLSRRQPPTRFVSNLGIISLWSKPSWRGELMRDLRSSQPSFVIVTERDALPTITYVNLDSEGYLKTFPELNSFITENYTPVASFDAFVVYRRNGYAPSGAEAPRSTP